jgi:para-aminobenzoate synthetase/4-amino-4-deoxychorismate lyase
MLIDPSEPFILLDDARTSGAGPALLYRGLVDRIEVVDPDEVAQGLARLRAAAEQGLHAAGFLSYEAGHALEPRLAPFRETAGEGEPPLLWFGLFDRVEQIAPRDVNALLPDPASAWNGPPRPLIDRDAYLAGVARVKEHIFAGDIYQANLTFAADLSFAGSPLALYARIRPRARAGHGGIVFTGAHWILSFSPELFFTAADGRLTTRPMKGTAVRRADPEADLAEKRMLRDDPKQRAENLMIVDLLRNDLSRVSRPGSVEVPSLFEVETYPTVHQMTSTITAHLEEGLGPVDAIAALFPCGSITGAPKIRATEIIATLERRRRGIYTGAIGRVAPGGDASFNVAIRTLTINAGEHTARLGLGSGIVADSRPADEWRECLAKGAFLEERTGFDLIETMRFDPRDGICALDRHLARMKASADALGFRFDRHDARNELQAATFRLREDKLLRLLLSPSGAVSIEARPLPAHSSEPVPVAIMPLPVDNDDFRLRHKTTDRAFYDEARSRSGAFEVLFRDSSGFLTEGSFTHIFVEQADGRLVTPPLSRGLLPGILRNQLIEAGEAVEADLTDLPDRFFIGNSTRGLIRATLGPGG